ncbi:MAG TPA: hypothetical protein DCS30_20640, partial [Rhizobiales bacterium]|nr:hypothetical protein [Hyphomicrobiales bacterium]
MIMTIQHSNLPLGTAAWKTFQGEDPCFDYGDLWLSRTPDGKAVGLRDKSHVLLTCLTRYGKGTTFIIPNLLLWQGSTVVLDPKGENAIITARRRGHGSCYCGGMGQRVRIFDPYNIVQREDDKFLDLKVRFNPMDPIDPDDPESTDIAAIIADSMVVKGQQSDFWSEAARDLIESIILYVKVSDSIENKDRNLTKVRELLLAGEVAMVEALGFDDNELPTPFEMMFMGMKRTKAFGGLVARAGQHWLEMYLKSERTFFSIVQTASTNTKFLDSAQIQEVVSCSDFELSEIKLDPKGSNIFLS